MSSTEMINKVINLIKENVDECRDADINEETPLIESNLLNSFALVSLLPVFESEFNITFELDTLEFESFATVLKIVEMINSLK